MLSLMKKTLLGFLAVVLAGFSLTFLTPTNPGDTTNAPLTTFNVDQQQAPKKDLTQEVIRGEEYDIQQGVYVFRDGITGSTTEFPGSNIVKFADSASGRYYGISVKSVRLNILEYADSKEDFLSKYRHVGVFVLLAENFWNHLRGWSNWEGEFPGFKNWLLRFNLSGGTINDSHVIWNDEDLTHSSNERVRLSIIETWENDNTLILDWYISAMVQWGWLSPVSHAAIIKIWKAEFKFGNF